MKTRVSLNGQWLRCLYPYILKIIEIYLPKFSLVAFQALNLHFTAIWRSKHNLILIYIYCTLILNGIYWVCFPERTFESMVKIINFYAML